MVFTSVAILIGCEENSVNLTPPTDLNIHFQQGFADDSVSAEINGITKYSAVIATSADSGFAASFSTKVSDGRHLLTFRIHGSMVSTEYSIDVSRPSLFVTVSYSRVNGRLYLDSSTEPPIYTNGAFKEKLFFSSFLSGSAQNIFMMDIDGSNMTQLTHYSTGEYRGPRISPDGRSLLYYRFDGEDGSGTLQNGIFLKNIYDPDPENWLDYGISCNFSPDGDMIVYENGGIKSLRLSDMSFTQITSNTTDPKGNPTTVDWAPAYSPDGSKIVFNSWRPIDDSDTLAFRHWDVMLMDSDGSNLRTLVRQMSQWCSGPVFYPDGNRILFTRHAGTGEYFISAMNLTDSTWHDIARAPSHSRKPSFNPDGSRIYFQAGYPAGSSELYWVSSSGGLYWKVFGNQVADTDPYVRSAWVYE